MVDTRWCVSGLIGYNKSYDPIAMSKSNGTQYYCGNGFAMGLWSIKITLKSVKGLGNLW